MKIKSSLWTLCFCFAGLTSCSTQPNASASANGVPTVVEPAPIPVSPTDTLAAASTAGATRVTFMDLDVFDEELSNALKANPNNVEVVFPAPVTTNQLPARLNKWVVALKDGGGSINTEPKTRTMLPLAFSLFGYAYSYVKEAATYSPAKGYDLTLGYNPSSGQVQKFSFVKKTSGILEAAIP